MERRNEVQGSGGAAPRRAMGGRKLRGRATGPLLERLVGYVTTTGPRDARAIRSVLSGDELIHVPRCTADDVVEAAGRSREAQRAWVRRPLAERARIILRFHDRLLRRQAEVLDLIQLESGKARRHAFEEVADTAMVARYYANTAKEHLRPRKRSGAIPGLTTAWEVFHPRGVIGFISPWNYPLSLSATDALPALLAGNGAVLKPDSQAPLTALWVADVLLEAGLPPGLFQVVTGEGKELGEPLIRAVDFISFTGSTSTGRIIGSQAGAQLIDCSLELGGKNAMLVLDDVDLDRAAAGAVQGCFASAGQLCISTERLYVHQAVYDSFLRRFVEKARALRLGNALDFGPEVGSLASEPQLRKVQEHVEDAVAKGARVILGGRARPELGPFFFEPTILEGVKEGMLLYRSETFGPVVAVYPMRSDDDGVEAANDSAYGLAASVWTSDPERGRAVGERLEAGSVNVNEAYAAAWASVDAPMGGFKDSGIGRRHGREGIRRFTEPQTIAIQRGPLLGAPSGEAAARRYARLMTALLRAWRRLPLQG